MSSEPIEIFHPRLGRLLVSGWTFGSIGKILKTNLQDKDGADFARGFFSLLARKVDEDAPLTDAAMQAGQPLVLAELNALTEEDLDQLACAYLNGECGSIGHEAKGDEPPDDETHLGCLARRIKRQIEMCEESRKLFAQQFGKLSLSENLTQSLFKTSNLANTLERMIPVEALSGASLLGIGDSMFKMGIPGIDAAFPSGGLPPIPKAPPPIQGFKPPPNPIHETNNLLESVSHDIDKLAENIGTMVAISQQQAALIQSLSETATLALAEAASSSEETRKSAKLTEKSTRLAKIGVWVAVFAIVISVGISLYAISDSHSIALDNGRQMDELISVVRESVRSAQGKGTENSDLVNELIETQRKVSDDLNASLLQLRKRDTDKTVQKRQATKGEVGPKRKQD